MEAEARSTGKTLWVAGALMLLVALGLGIPILAADHYGALGIPRGDDWSYILTLFRFSDTGQLNGNNWVSMTLLGQIGLALPIVAATGHSITALQVLTAILGLAGLLATIALGRGLIGVASASVVALTVCAGPLWGPLAVSYMTDVPTFAAAMIALAFAARSFESREHSMGWFVAAMAVALLAFSIRQYAGVLLVAVPLVAMLPRSGATPRPRRAIAVVTVAMWLAAVAVYGYWQAIPDLKLYVPTLPDADSVSVLVIKGGGYIRLIGLLTLPVVALAGPASIVRRAWRRSAPLATLVGSVVLLWLVALSVHVPKQEFVGNYVESNGALTGNVMFGNRPDIFPTAIFVLLVIAATLSAVVLSLAAVPPTLALVDRARRRAFAVHDPVIVLLTIVALGYTAAYAVAMATGVSVYDRYVLPVIPLVCILLLWSTRRAEEEEKADAHTGTHVAPARDMARVVPAAVALVCLAAVGVAFTLDSASFDGARWRTATAATGKGYSAHEINGGFEWLNYYRGHMKPQIITGTGAAVEPDSFCVTLYVNPRHIRGKTIAVGTYTLPTRKPARIVAVRNDKPCTATPRLQESR